jgi:hypothetical protein
MRSPSPRMPAGRLRTDVAATIGAVLEWFDLLLYALFAVPRRVGRLRSGADPVWRRDAAGGWVAGGGDGRPDQPRIYLSVVMLLSLGCLAASARLVGPTLGRRGRDEVIEKGRLAVRATRHPAAGGRGCAHSPVRNRMHSEVFCNPRYVANYQKHTMPSF